MYRIAVFVVLLSSCVSDNRQGSASDRPAPESHPIDQYLKDSIEDSSLKGYTVKQLSGQHKYGGKTKVTYQSLSQRVKEIQATAQKNMWTDYDRDTEINIAKVMHEGGQIQLEVERNTIETASTQYFTIIIKDLAEKELYRVKLPGSVPQASLANGMWWNIALVDIDRRVRPPFYIYVVDAIQDGPFKFEVQPLKK